MPRSRPLLPLTFTQHPEGEELPPPFPSSAPRPCRPRERRSLLAAPPFVSPLEAARGGDEADPQSPRPRHKGRTRTSREG